MDTGQAPPIRNMPYQLPKVWKQPVKEEFWELLRLKIITHSTSPWSFPIVRIRKPDGKVRICVDYRRLNSITNPNPYYIPLVDKLLQKVGSSQVLSKIDLAKGFYQVGLTDEARARSAFVTAMGKFELLRMPFGMRNAPPTLQRLMDIVLKGKETFCTAYIDDILIYSSTGVEHIGHVSEVLEVLQKNCLTAKPSNSVWGMETIEYLGHRIGKGQVAVPEARTKAITKYQKPQKQSDIRAFLGVTGYYRKFIRNYAFTAQPLSAALRKTEPKEIIWTPEREKAFYTLEKPLCDVCYLTIPTPEDTYIVYTDASYMGIGGVLSVSREGLELPVAFFTVSF